MPRHGGSSVALRLVAAASLGWALSGCSSAPGSPSPAPATATATAAAVATPTTTAPATAIATASVQPGQQDITKIPLVTGIYTADPAAHVFGDRLYVYTSHDRDTNLPDDSLGGQYDMTDYHVLSFADMHTLPADLGEILNVKDVPWAEKQMWAPDAAFKNGTYYLISPPRTGKASSASGWRRAHRRPARSSLKRSRSRAASASIPRSSWTTTARRTCTSGDCGAALERWESGTYDANAEPGGGDGGQKALGPKGRQAVRGHAEL